MIYREDFSDPRSGWPNHGFNENTHAHYINGAYELDRHCVRCTFSPPSVPGIVAAAADTMITAYGPWWEDFRASASLEAFWEETGAGVGMVFDFREEGYYAFLVGTPNTFELVKGGWDGKRTEIIPPTPLGFSLGRVCRLTVDRNGRQITLLVNDRQVGNVEDYSFEYGQVGFGVFGSGRAVVHDLLVEAKTRN